MTIPYIPNPAVYPNSVQVPFLKLGKPQFENGVDKTPSRIAMATLTCKVPLPSLEAQRALFMSGACPMSYDGARVHEAGFNYYPEGVTGVGITTGSGLLTNGTYGIIFVYEWEDAKGVIWRSAPSVARSVALGANNALSCTLPHLRLTDKQGNYTDQDDRRGAVRLVGYRTAVNGTIYYRDSATVGSTNENNPGALSAATWITELSDALLIKNEVLYTTGGGLENDAWPSSTICCTHQRRVFTVTQEESSYVQYTDEIDERFLAPATNEVYRIPVPVEGGSVVGLASMDDKLIIFCQRRIYYVFGEGPNRLGAQNGYSLPQLCSASLGMLGGSHESVALTPEGIWFLSSVNGLRLLTRGLQIAMDQGADGSVGHLGREVDNAFTAAFTQIRAHSVTGKNQVRWYLAGPNTVVVWDYQQQQWSTFTNHNSAGGSVSARNVFWHASTSALYSSKTTAGGTDDGVTTNYVVETAWMALADLQGYQRIYKALLLGQTLQNYTVAIAVGYDYDDAWITGNGAFAFPTFAASSSGPLQIEHPMHKQVCGAVRFRFTIVPGFDGECVRLTAMTLSVGVKKGTFKVASSKRF